VDLIDHPKTATDEPLLARVKGTICIVKWMKVSILPI
jgi:hypothetical protein